jgi:outer membrane cobalamin receptor
MAALLCLVAAAVIAVACPAGAQDTESGGAIEGTVLRADDGTPLAGVEVRVVESDVRVHTDSQGRFKVASMPPGSYTLEFRHTHFSERTSERITVMPFEVTELNVVLDRLPVFLDEVVVSPSRYTLYREQPETRTSLSREAIRRMPHLSDDLFRALERLPGVTGEQISARVNIRGGEIDETMVVIDGLELYEAFHLSDMFSIFGIVDAEAIGGLDMMTGGFPAEYGNRMSGVIDIVSSTPVGGRTELGISTTNLGAFSEGQFAGGRGYWLVSARRTFFDRMIEWIDPESGFKPVFYDLFGKVSYQIGGRTTVAANILAARDDLSYVETDDSGRETEEVLQSTPDSAYVWLNIFTAWSSRLDSRTVLSHGLVEGAREGWVEYYWYDGVVHDNRKLSFIGLKQDWSLKLGSRQIVKWGFDLRRLEAGYDYLADAAVRDPLFTGGPPRPIYRDYDFDVDGNTYGIYAGDRVRLSDSLVAELGLRWDRQTYYEDDQLSPRVNLAYALGKRSVLRAAWGRYYQPQYINELQVEDGVTEFYPAQLAEHFMVGFEHAFSKDLDFRVEAYSKDLADIRPHFENQFNPIEVFPEIEPDRILVAPDRATARGIELTLIKNGPALSWWLSYAYSKAEDQIEGEWVPRSWDQPHTLNFSVNYNRRQRWNFNLSGIYHTGWPTTAIEPQVTIGPDGWRYYSATLGPRNAERFDDYLRFDLRASRSFQLSHGRLDLILEVINLLNRENQAYVEGFGLQGTPDGGVEMSLEREGFLPLIPTVGIRWTF